MSEAELSLLRALQKGDVILPEMRTGIERSWRSGVRKLCGRIPVPPTSSLKAGPLRELRSCSPPSSTDRRSQTGRENAISLSHGCIVECQIISCSSLYCIQLMCTRDMAASATRVLVPLRSAHTASLPTSLASTLDERGAGRYCEMSPYNQVKTALSRNDHDNPPNPSCFKENVHLLW